MRGIVSAATALLLLAAQPAAAGETPVQEVINGPATWRQEVTVDGIVIVTETGSLTVDAGTRVVFTPRDDDDDGIGDSELRVEGSLVVGGTPAAPVVFTSGADKPEAADWKYVMINHARAVAVDHAVFQYAYSGVQVHYTRGTFRHLTGRNNVDGFRFSTAPVTLSDSVLTGNVNGIRFEERGAGARVTGNRVTGNEIGLFAVTRCGGLSVIEDNIIAGNSRYNVKIGFDQADDLPLPGNWWGTTDPVKIEETFFDGRREPSLGRVLYEPYLMTSQKVPSLTFFDPVKLEAWGLKTTRSE